MKVCVEKKLSYGGYGGERYKEKVEGRKERKETEKKEEGKTDEKRQVKEKKEEGQGDEQGQVKERKVR